MNNKLLLYQSEDFDRLKAEKRLNNSEIVSITKYINDVSRTDYHFSQDIIDISSIAEFNNKQSIAEQVIYRFTDDLVFICDVAKWETLSYELRHLFENSAENPTITYKCNEQDLAYNNDESPKLLFNNRTLSFYARDDFYAFEKYQYEKGYTIVSITKYISKSGEISGLNTSSVIVDITSISDYNRIQSIAEECVYQSNEDTIFICDLSKKDQLEYELRLAFNMFKTIEENDLFDKKLTEKLDKKNVPQLLNRHKKITDLTVQEKNCFFSNFRERLYGHPKFKDDFEDQVNTFRVFNQLGEHKILSLFLMGDSGVGKTEVARLIFECMGGAKTLAKINFGNYSNEFSLSSLIGSARGYIGSDDGEIFMKVRDTDIGVLLIDEFEKSNAALFNYFLDVLESGKMTGSLGQEIDLNGFIIVFTSNISKEDYKKRISPELRSRFDYKCMFTLLGNEDKRKYIEFRAKSIVKKLNPDANPELEETLSNHLKLSIDVSKYQNMRDINKQIKKVFVEYLVATALPNKTNN